MKTRWQGFNLPQRILLLLQVFLFILFLILYATIGCQQVIKYQDALFRRRTDGDIIFYSGKLNGETAVFTVSPGPVVKYRWGDTLYGPYIITEDPTAVPDEEDLPEYIISTRFLTGVEVREGSDTLFRGAFLTSGSVFLVLSEDGTPYSPVSVVVGSNTKMEPSVRSILRIACAPDPTPRGHWELFLLGAFVCVINAVSILFADTLFRFHLQFRVKYPEDAEPSDWELFSRWVGWVVLTITALVLFIVGLNMA